MQVRRERISERLKALQLLVPNGEKVGDILCFFFKRLQGHDHHQFVHRFMHFVDLDLVFLGMFREI